MPSIPSVLHRTLWGVAAYFNPTRNPWLPQNLMLFAQRVRAQGLKLAIIELAHDRTGVDGAEADTDGEFEIDASVCDLLLQRRCDVTLWQKERLLNLAIAALPAACDKVVWLDGDILFENPDWVGQTASLLDRHPVVQPFDRAVWLTPDTVTPPEHPPRGLGEGCEMPGMAATMASGGERQRLLADYFNHGHPGFAWAARRTILAKHPLYDRHILGGGDVTIAHAIFGDRDYWRGLNMACRDMTAAEIAAMGSWGRAFHGAIDGSIGYVPGRVRHLWHGPLAQRGYRDRWKILRQADYDPLRDVAVDADRQCLRWASDKPVLHRQVAGYFQQRSAVAAVAA
ncbi:hypothetical protein [Sphingomonas sp. 37zxx]|uniref:hypothetical protein n=1 Tax=Sphingomonas sp. 37zxx TaxID=1550073 RepID=UPI00053BEF87|nr:hypothetical protein [Sphingomonas sp. 37zxx]